MGVAEGAVQESICGQSLLLLFSTYLPTTTVYTFAHAHLPADGADAGLEVVECAAVLSLMAVATVVGRFGMAAVKITSSRGVRFLCALMLVCLSAALLLLAFVREAAAFYVAAVFLGAGLGIIVLAMPLLIGLYFPSQLQGRVYGILDGVSWGVGSALGPLLGGVVYDLVGSYQHMFL